MKGWMDEGMDEGMDEWRVEAVDGSRIVEGMDEWRDG